MQAKFWKYTDPEKQTVCFRAYVEWVEGKTINRHISHFVNSTATGAMKEAKKILRDLKKKMK